MSSGFELWDGSDCPSAALRVHLHHLTTSLEEQCPISDLGRCGYIDAYRGWYDASGAGTKITADGRKLWPERRSFQEDNCGSSWWWMPSIKGAAAYTRRKASRKYVRFRECSGQGATPPTKKPLEEQCPFHVYGRCGARRRLQRLV